MQIGLGAVGQIVGAALAALIGVWFAARLNRRQSEAIERRADLRAAREAVFTIWQMRNALANHRVQYLDPVREHHLRHLVLPPMMVAVDDSVVLHPKNLGFLWDAQALDLLAKLSVTNFQFMAVAHIFKERARLWQEQLNPAAQGLRPMGRTLTVDELSRTLDTATQEVMRSAIDRAYQYTDELANSLPMIDAALREVCRARFPGAVGFDFAA